MFEKVAGVDEVDGIVIDEIEALRRVHVVDMGESFKVDMKKSGNIFLAAAEMEIH
jgi:hypothetical protein